MTENEEEMEKEFIKLMHASQISQSKRLNKLWGVPHQM
jgi:hypothetical protein